ncbi:uncharacterized protein N7500_004356 [Penicillium coprophilum]|uniref:uncharacterized protein n=1 Tax=Penicillium coprophilum TaxID=36646 RepID=UPI00238727FA|nr:uncharacterized protein N7500_010968 [Penicillium coprophilum]XP_056536027.1 uncharacterized protein N7500_004356 [Penicillium coprophilum]KAJ5150779.1 hypothetical protein N7500_010968 [Penicillium coprophilum]KAJ5171573.1 hypothetical protein N7500_004356 [Penicillium coprophilum]
MPTESAKPCEHYKDRKFLLELELVVDESEEHKIHEFDLAKLKGFGIDHQRMILNREDSTQPSFFAPYPSILGPSDSTVDGVGLLSKFEDTCFTDPVDRARQVAGPYNDDYTPKDLFQDDEPEFGPFGMTDIRGKAFPRTKAFMYNNPDATDDTTLRGELLTILRLMLGQLRKVFLVSFMGKRARAFESYFNGRALALRTTQLYKFPEETSLGFKHLAELYLSSPTGDTF